MPEALAKIYASMDSSARRELYDFALFLASRPKKTRKRSEQKPIDAEYNALSKNERDAVCASARATIWEQIKDDEW